MNPEITVLISTYNNARYVAKKLEEVRRQTWFDRAEFLFLETGSPEREREQIEPFCREHPHCRLLATEDRKTLYQSWNMGWEAARAPWICYSNMDDCMHPRLLESVVAQAGKRGWDLCTVLIGKQEMDASWNSFDPEVLRRRPLSPRPGPFTAWRADLRPELGGFDDRFVAAGDKEFWARAASRGLRIGLIREILYLYTRSPGQLTRQMKQSPILAQEKSLLAGKPFRVEWPGRLRRQVLWCAFWRRLFPRRYLPD